MSKPKWISARGKLLTKDMVLRTKSITNTAINDGVVSYSYGRCTGTGFGCNPSGIGRAIFMEHVTSELERTLKGDGSDERWSASWTIDIMEG
jgi:hypothetical protein